VSGGPKRAAAKFCYSLAEPQYQIRRREARAARSCGPVPVPYLLVPFVALRPSTSGRPTDRPMAGRKASYAKARAKSIGKDEDIGPEDEAAEISLVRIINADRGQRC